MIPLERNIRAAMGRVYVRVVAGNRERHELILESVLPILPMATYAIIYRFLGTPSTYVGFVVVGGVMLGFWLNVLWMMGAQFYWEKEMGNLELYLIAPISRMFILLGMALGGMVNTVARAGLTLVIGIYLFGVTFELSQPWLLIIVFVLALIALYTLGMVFASLFMMYGREAWHTANLLQEPIYFLSGVYYPIRVLPFWLQAAASLIPLTISLDAIRILLFLGGGVEQIAVHILSLGGLAILLLVLARLALQYMENLGKREGRLTLRWT